MIAGQVLRVTAPARAETFEYKGMVYEYGHVETRAPPQLRTNEFVRAAATFAVQRQTPFLGHKSLPLTSQLPGYDCLRYIPGEIMHGTILLLNNVLLSCVYDGILNVLLACNPTCNPVHSDTKIMTDMTMTILIGKGPAKSSYGNWSKDDKHRRQAKIRNIYEDVWPENGGPLPW